MGLRDDDKPFEADVGFAKQREYYSEFATLRPYLIDWLIAIYWELQGQSDPFEYATRVCISKEIVENINTDHTLSAHLVLRRVIRNLFPYEQIKDNTSIALRDILGNQRGKVKINKFRALRDNIVDNPKLVSMRYKVLAEAFCAEANALITLLRERVEDDYIPKYLSLGDECREKCAERLQELVKNRQLYYFNYPDEHLTSVSNFSIKNEGNLKKRSDVPKDMEPEYIYKIIAKLSTSIRNDLQAVLIQSKDICSTVLRKKKYYFSEINQLLVMSNTIRGFASDGPFDDINIEITSLSRFIDDTFKLSNFLPQDILDDLEKGNTLYRNGYL